MRPDWEDVYSLWYYVVLVDKCYVLESIDE